MSYKLSEHSSISEDVELLVNKALKNKDVNENFYNQVLEREKYSSTAFYGKFAIPHSNVQNANVTKLYIMVNQEGVKWDDENIKLIFLILIKREAANDFRKLYVGITETLYHSNVVFNNLDKIKTVEDIYNINTLGFRGEALPSIASVSKVNLKSKIQEEAFGLC